MGQERSVAIGMIHDSLVFTPVSELTSEKNAFRLLGAQTLFMEVLDANTFTKEDLSILRWELEQLGLELIPRTENEVDHQ
jgi:hypothetical protein